MADLRFLRDGALPGATNMAWDEALLECAAVPTLRLYRWSAPTVSLGYFQDLAALLPSLGAAAGSRGLPDLVRRITGGGAIWHEHEVTYCLVGTLGADGFPPQARLLYPLLHQAIRNALLAAGGVDAALQAVASGDRRYRDEPRCFASPAVDDLTAPAGGGKILGSAARARGSRILIHGSLKLASNPWDQAVVSGCGLSAEAAGEALAAGISTALAATLRADVPTVAEQVAAARIATVRYGTDDWVARRSGPRP